MELEVEGYRGKVEDLKSECQSLLEDDHFASDDIKQRQVRYHLLYSIFRCFKFDILKLLPSCIYLGSCNEHFGQRNSILHSVNVFLIKCYG